MPIPRLSVVTVRDNDAPVPRHSQPVLEQRVVASQSEVDDMYEPVSPNDLVRKEWTEKAPCPDEVMATLLPYQAEG